ESRAGSRPSECLWPQMHEGSQWKRSCIISFLKRKCWKHMVYMDDDHVCACPCCRGYIVCRCDSSIPGFSLFCTKLSDIFRRFHHPNGPLRCDRQPFHQPAELLLCQLPYFFRISRPLELAF